MQRKLTRWGALGAIVLSGLTAAGLSVAAPTYLVKFPIPGVGGSGGSGGGPSAPAEPPATPESIAQAQFVQAVRTNHLAFYNASTYDGMSFYTGGLTPATSVALTFTKQTGAITIDQYGVSGEGYSSDYVYLNWATPAGIFAQPVTIPPTMEVRLRDPGGVPVDIKRGMSSYATLEMAMRFDYYWVGSDLFEGVVNVGPTILALNHSRAPAPGTYSGTLELYDTATAEIFLAIPATYTVM